MTTISELYEAHHRKCDEAFAEAEGAASDSKWDMAKAATTRFTAMLEAHFQSEEGTLFPAFEAAAGMRTGPTAVMRLEHEQMRGLIGSLGDAAKRQAKDDFLGACETLLVLMQQHNLKEENILYPMCDRALSDAALLTTIGQQLA
jgi:hemerythrin-like domain-containing protein